LILWLELPKLQTKTPKLQESSFP